MNNDRMISDVEHLLGRVINSQGEPIDERGPISSATCLPLYDFAGSETKAAASPVSMIEMGIKVIDLLAPVPRGGIFAMHSMPGLGKLVVQQEMIHNLITYYDGYVAGIGMDESSYDASELVAPLEDFPDKNRMVLVFEQMSDSQEIIQRLIRVGLTIAIELRQQGHEVMFIVDKNVVAKTDSSTLGALKRVIQEQGLITLLLTPEEVGTYPSRQRRSPAATASQSGRTKGGGVQRDEENDVLNVLDAQIFFSRELAKQNIWPAVDRMKSTSRLLESSRGDGLPRPIEEHREVARQVRELLQRYATSQATSAEDQQMVKRAQRVQLFLTQPFFVAEAFTDIPGEFVPLAETLKGCKELLEGRYDDVPVEAFRFVGTIEQALAKAKVLDG
jgi:F-type H+-transporting ATPase subunit beta